VMKRQTLLEHRSKIFVGSGAFKHAFLTFPVQKFLMAFVDTLLLDLYEFF